MRGWAKSFEPSSKIQNAQAMALFDSALRLDPDNVEAMIGKAKCLSNDVNFGWSVSVIEDKKQATNLIDRALSKSPGNAGAHWVKATLLLLGHAEEALVEYDAALEIDPNLQFAYASKGLALMLSGRAREALPIVQLALRISPKDPFAYFWHWELCHAHLRLHEYEEAIEECRRSMNLNNAYYQTYMDLIAAYGTTGQMEQARQALAEFKSRFPNSNLTLQKYRQVAYAASSNPQFRREVDDIVDGLRKGGIPEQ